MDLYFDNAAAMRPSPGLVRGISVLAEKLFTNQESPVSGMNDVISDASFRIRNDLCGKLADRYDVLFVNTGTDAVNAAFLAVREHFHGGDIVLSGGEHASVRAAACRIGKDFTVKFIPCGKGGRIGEDEIASAVSPQTVFAALHLVQAETGMVQNPALLRDKLPDALLFIDAIQGIGKVPFDIASCRPDLFAVSGQKLGIPSGAALIFRKDLAPLFRKIRFEEHRIGRLPPMFIQMLADAVDDWTANGEAYRARAKSLRDLLLSELERRIGGMFLRTVPADIAVSPFITHLLLTDGKTAFQGAIITRALSGKGIIAAPGSACDAETKTPSAALTWMKIPKHLAFSALRISLSPWNDEDGIRALAAALEEILHHY